ncbi:putative polysaccharide biosynthesis protein [Eubacterium oxidoreducens]|uniref:Stage V sporulation protein B n=1 Tax=Eubacterium oxidoreducens TaxID=1732 RepID=A0A1G6AL85_EUBOX|nr:polysaccharide biosynthesis protein [Eubacterium oxidoreducens]SDB09156.1 stage V sporulation protein B [Eubacterium oxidoreducens]
MAGKGKKSNFLIQGSILAIASIISRIIGLVYRIPMQQVIGDGGNNLYGTAYEIYNVFLLISSFSLPLAVSKLVSTRVAQKDRKNAYRYFKGSLFFAIISGLAVTLIVFFGAGFFADIMNTPFSYYALRVLAPTLFIVAVMGTIRGFFQGLGTTMPSAISQIIEQIVNAIISIIASYVLFSYGAKVGAVMGDQKNYAEAYGAAGGTLGTCIGAVIGLFFISFVFFAYRPVMKRLIRKEKKNPSESYRRIIRIVIMTIIPVLLSTTIYNISSVIDNGLFKAIAEHQGYSAEVFGDMWGIFSGKTKLLLNVPIAIASALAASTVPTLAAAYANKDMELLRKRIHSAIRFTMLIAFPCAVGMGVLAGPILQLLFSDTNTLSAQMLSVGAISIIFYSLSTISNGILQGIDKMRVPVTNAIYALILHVAFLVVLMMVFDLNIMAVVMANTFYAFIMCILNHWGIRKEARYKQEIKKTFLLPGLSSCMMGIIVFGVYKALFMLLKANSIATVVAIVIGMLSYAIIMIVSKGITKAELETMPKGNILIKIFEKLHLM